MFNKKSKQIKNLSETNKKLKQNLQSIKQLCSYKKDDYDDFILILEQIQETNNKNLQWKKKQTIINNEVSLAIENYNQKIAELKEEI